MWLHIDGQSLPVVQAGNASLKLRDRVMLPGGLASLEITVDGQSYHSAVNVSPGGGSRWIQISPVG